MRKCIDFNQDWKFSKTASLPGTCPEDWETVHLPHTWNAEDGQDGGDDYWRGTAVYCKQLSNNILNPGERVFLEINGAANTAEVFVNGTRLSHHDGGYSTFRTDLTDELKDENLICITVDNSPNDRIYPQKADFTFYGGLYRNVNLIVVPEKHFELEKDGTPGMKITPCVSEDRKSAAVTVETWQNGGDCVRVTIGDKTCTADVVNGYACTEVILENVHLWDGAADPYLYTVKAELLCGGEACDEISLRFGCRTIEFDPVQGFRLNGRNYPLRGVSRHQDRIGIGNALTMKEHREDMEMIREIGANTIRLAHYQHAQEFYDLCDEYGMVIWAEIPYITEHMPGGRQNTLDQMRELITQCYHHPSIVCWGLSNEVAVHGVTEDLMENHRLLNDLCHKMDSTRPTTMAHAFMLEHDNPLVNLPDIASYNLYFGWYLGTLEQNDSFFDEYHEKFPDRVMGFSEYGADANPVFQSARPESGDYTEQYQCVYHEYILDCIDRHPWLWATHVWNMFDFAADGRDEGGAHGLNQKGLVSFDRQLKKDAFWLYKAAWNKTDQFVHLCGKRYVNRAEETTEIKVYSNLPEVTLYVDGKEAETKTGSRVFVFRIPLSGEHTVNAVSGECTDTMTIRRCEKPDPSYRFKEAGSVSNWFDEDTFRTDCFSIRDSYGVLMAHPEAGKLVQEIMNIVIASRGDVARSANSNPNLQKMMAGMSFESLLKKAGDTIPQETAEELNRKLQQIKKS
ncbi:MAG: hypothetical protein IJJ29_01555 [Solobacterium sp.]|nr:hypothetical protein [Solobacterium sp.]